MEALSFAGNLLLFIIALGLIIFVHELGHFATAKWVGIRVSQFALGFGKAALAWRKGMGVRVGTTETETERRVRSHLNLSEKADLRPEDMSRALTELGLGETEYRLNYVPLGGYVKMLGQEDLGAADNTSDPRAFNNKPVWQRMIVISAGVVMNLIFAVIFFIGAFMIGVDFPPARVGSVVWDSPASSAKVTSQRPAPDAEPAPAAAPPNDTDRQPEPAADAPADAAEPGDPADARAPIDLAMDSDVGLKPGDWILSINGDRPSDFNEVKVAVALSDGPMELVVERPAFDGEPARVLRFRIEARADEQIPQIGIAPPSSLTLARPADGPSRRRLQEHLGEFGLEPTMKLVAVDGRPIDAHWQYQRLLNASGGEPMRLTFQVSDGDERIEARIQPRSLLDAAVADGLSVEHLLGLVPVQEISYVDPEGAAAGRLQPGDRVLRIGDLDWPRMGQFGEQVQDADQVALLVEREGQDQPVEVVVEPRPERFGMWGRRLMGIAYGPADDSSLIAYVLPDSPFGRLGIPRGSRITHVAGQPVDSLSAVRREILAAGSTNIPIRYQDPVGGGKAVTAQLELDREQLRTLAAMPWRDPIVYFDQAQELQKADDPLAAAGVGFQKTWLFLEQTYVMIVRLVDQSVSPKNLMGPVGIATAGIHFADRGWSYLLWFMGLISVNLAVINFLPLPIVDGGLFVMLVIEKIRGKPLPLQVQSAISLVGLIMLGAVFLFVTYNDIIRLVGG